MTSASTGMSPIPVPGKPVRKADQIWPDAALAERARRVERALSVGGDRFSPQVAAAAGVALERARQRIGLGADVTVVAFAGATGSGKSSLFNALAQMDISTVASRRPTTSAPQACVWGVDIADPLLDWLGVAPRDRTQRESVLDADHEAALAGLVLLDLPDHDSAVLSHHLEVDRLIDLVDLLIWVVDPQKYADDSLHSGYLKSLAGRQETMLVVLNQVDRLDENAVQTCRHDLRRLLDADGLTSVGILATSVSRGDGITDLRNRVAEVVGSRRKATERARADLDDAFGALRADLGDQRPQPIPQQATEDIVRTLGEASGLPVLLDVVVEGYRRRMSRWSSCAFRRWRRRFRPDPSRGTDLKNAEEILRSMTGGSLSTASSSQRSRVEIALRDMADGLGKDLPSRWAEDLRISAWAGREDLPGALDSVLVGLDLTFPRPKWWRVLGAVESMMALATTVGFAWLAWLGISQWVLGTSSVGQWTSNVGSLPFVLGLAFGGLVLGGVLAVVMRFLVAVTARRRRAAIEEQFVVLVTKTVQDIVLTPIQAVLDDFRRVREVVDVPV